MSWVIAILRVILEVFLPVLMKDWRGTSEDAAADPGADRLKAKIKEVWG